MITMSKVRAVAYLRVSQADENIENQRVKILEFAKEKGLEIVGFFADIDVSGTTPPRERPQYRAMLEFCKINGINTIVFYDLSRLARSVEEGLQELKRLTEEGYQFYFAGMDFLNYDIDPMLRKKVIMDFLWFAELYVEDIKKRTAAALERLKMEKKIYHRPRLIHYVALWLTGKKKPKELTENDVEKAKEYVRNLLEPYAKIGLSKEKLRKIFLDHMREMYRKHPRAPRDRRSFLNLLRDAGIA